jgi:predicted ATP-grasp superfamily ATP-dependent carboligase
VASSELSFVGASRHCSWRHRIPGPDDGLERFIDAVAAAVSKVGYDIVFPGGDAELLALATGREGVPAILPFPDIAVVRRALDKLELAGAAARVGIDVPETKVATAEAIRAMTYPVLVKARLHWVPGSSGCSSRIEGVVARDPEMDESDLHARVFVPGWAISEDPATGSCAASRSAPSSRAT